MSGPFLFSCSTSAVHLGFSGSDSLVIHFKNERANVITKTVQTTDKKAIERVVDFIDSGKTEFFKCGYDGKMFFYRQGVLFQEVDFKMKENDCNHFAFILDGNLVSTKLNGEAADFLSALERGDLFY